MIIKDKNMSKPLFPCTICGEDFTRRTSADRHRKNIHNGHHSIVRYIEYIAGRASSLYPPPITPRRLSRKKKLMEFHNNNQRTLFAADGVWHGGHIDNVISFNDDEKTDPIDEALNTLRKAVETKNLSEELSGGTQRLINRRSIQNYVPVAFNSTLASPQSKNSAIEYTGNQFVPEANNSGHNVSLSKEEEFRRDPVDDTWEWWLYKLRQRLEIKDLSSQLQSTPQHPVNIPFSTGIIQPPRSTNFPVMTQNGLLENNNNANNVSSKTFTINSNNMVNLRTPFGFRIHRCYICL